MRSESVIGFAHASNSLSVTATMVINAFFLTRFATLLQITFKITYRPSGYSTVQRSTGDGCRKSMKNEVKTYRINYQALGRSINYKTILEKLKD